MPPKLNLYSHSPMPTPPSSPDEEEENAIFDPSEEENNNDITSALEGEDNDDNDSNEDIEDDGDENENNETITNLQASFQTRLTALTQTLNRLTARTLAIRYQHLHFQINPTASLSNQDTQGENTQQTHLAVLRLREKIIEREIGEVRAQMQALRAEIEAAVESSDHDDDHDNDDGDEIMEEGGEMQEYNHEQNMDYGDGATTEEIVEVDEDWLLLNNVDDNDDVDDDVMEEIETEEYDRMEDKN
ncbi:hypothetical protein D6D21_08163 [Aureobasidium pullulans]|uniref:Uncharacterized protein n=1 Tax=Aureobasidium pullulans TaxID=5580 RepID=A0AB74IPU4_AURPU|nr:hypothetical protein D6D21_08163 [Aureobasidium pullulans]